MFDANARHLPKGYKFFSVAHWIQKHDYAYNLGIRQDDVLICHMLNECDRDPIVDVTINGKVVSILSSRLGFCTLLEYAGSLNGEDFICESTRKRAMKLLEKLPK